MSDNKLLTENTIRRFMKLANVDALSDTFIAENQKEENLEEENENENLEEEINEEEINEEEEVELEEQMDEEDPEEDPAAEEPDMEMDVDMGDAADEPAAPGAADMSLTEEEAQVLIDLGKRLEEAMAGAEDAPEDPEMDDEEGPEMDDDPAMAYGDPAMAYNETKESHDDLVQEVLKRVTKRLVAEKLKR